MKNLLVVSFFLLGLVNLVQGQEENKEDPPFASFKLDSLVKHLETSGKSWVSFFKGKDVLTGLYMLKAGAEDRQKPHDTDEVYYVVSGKSKFLADGKEMDAGAGSILYVNKEIDHHFFDIEEDMFIIVFFDQ